MAGIAEVPTSSQLLVASYGVVLPFHLVIGTPRKRLTGTMPDLLIMTCPITNGLEECDEIRRAIDTVDLSGLGANCRFTRSAPEQPLATVGNVGVETERPKLDWALINLLTSMIR